VERRHARYSTGTAPYGQESPFGEQRPAGRLSVPQERCSSTRTIGCSRSVLRAFKKARGRPRSVLAGGRADESYGVVGGGRSCAVCVHFLANGAARRVLGETDGKVAESGQRGARLLHEAAARLGA